MSTTINETIANDLKDAMRAKDQTAMLTLRALKSALKYAAVEKIGADGVLEDTDAEVVIRQQRKQRIDSVDKFTEGGRPDLADKEKAEIAILERYLPAFLGEAEIQQLVDTVIAELGATTKQQMGQVMKALQERAGDRADGKALSKAVAAKLK